MTQTAVVVPPSTATARPMPRLEPVTRAVPTTQIQPIRRAMAHASCRFAASSFAVALER